MNIHSVYAVFQRRFRPRRIRALKKLLPLIEQPHTKILDLGGTASWWAEVRVPTPHITIVNIEDCIKEEVQAAGYEFVCADACKLPFSDGQFDLVISNSVIEHVGNASRQALFAKEMQRCGRAIYMQTPNRNFPVEPHLIALGLHWLPAAFQRKVIRWASVWGWVAKPTQAEIDEFVASTRLMSRAEVLHLFPDCVIHRETVLGLTKSFVAVKK